MRTLLVAYRHDNGRGPLQKLYRWVDLPWLPHEGMSLEYEEGWALSGVRYVYGSLDGSLEVGLSSKFNDEEATDLLATGHWHDEVTVMERKP